MKLKLKAKLLTLCLSISIIPVIVITIVALMNSSNALEEKAFNELEAIRQIKKQQIEGLFQSMSAQLRILKDDPFVIQALLEFNQAFEEEENKVLTPRWKALAKKYDPRLKNIKQGNGWYDIFLINTDGDIVYTVEREPDLGMIIPESDLKNSSLGKAFFEIREKGADDIAISDFEPYAPSNGDPASFMMAQMHGDQGEQVGYVAFQIPLDQINEIMKQRDGMGQTGETYLVGADKLMRSDSFLDPQGHSVLASFANPSTGSVDTEASRAALAGKTENKIIIDYNGNPVLSSYTSLEIGNLRWALLAEIDEAEAFESIQNLILIVSSISLVAILIVSGIAWLFAGSITGPIRKITTMLADLAEGDLTAEVEINTNDELGEMSRSLNHTIKNLSNMLREVKNNAESLSSSSEELSTISTQLASGSEEMSVQSSNVAGATEQMSTNISTMAAAGEEMSVNASSVSSAAEQMSTNMNAVASAVEEMSTAINKIAQNAQAGSKISEEAREMSGQATEIMGTLGTAANDIGQVTEIIKRIAEQTNLLALNATIEAASAGDAGKGFAVVANEIKELANQSAQAAEDIAKRIEGVQKNTETAVKVITDVSGIINNINESVDMITNAVEQQTLAANDISANVTQSNTGVNNIASSINEVAKGATDLSRNAGEAAKGANDVSSNILGVKKAAEDANANAQQVNSSSGELAMLAGKLNELVSKFKIAG